VNIVQKSISRPQFSSFSQLGRKGKVWEEKGRFWGKVAIFVLHHNKGLLGEKVKARPLILWDSDKHTKRNYCQFRNKTWGYGQFLSVEMSDFRRGDQGRKCLILLTKVWWRGQDLNLRPSGYEL